VFVAASPKHPSLIFGGMLRVEFLKSFPEVSYDLKLGLKALTVKNTLAYQSTLLNKVALVIILVRKALNYKGNLIALPVSIRLGWR
jgi:hypothetical protein